MAHNKFLVSSGEIHGVFGCDLAKHFPAVRDRGVSNLEGFKTKRLLAPRQMSPLRHC